MNSVRRNRDNIKNLDPWERTGICRHL